MYWRKDCRKYWISYVDANGERQREPGAEDREEAELKLATAKIRVSKNKNLERGELPECMDSFADVADRYLRYQKPRLCPDGYERAEGIVRQHLKPFFPGKQADIMSGQVSDYLTTRLGQVSKSTARKELITLSTSSGSRAVNRSYCHVLRIPVWT